MIGEPIILKIMQLQLFLYKGTQSKAREEIFLNTTSVNTQITLHLVDYNINSS